jgi:alpha-L-fucosidase
MNTHWGHNKNDDNWKSSKDLIQKLADICSKGGNFLLNVGPTSEGLFPQESVDRLEQIGDWMSANGEAIYGTSASPFQTLPWGRCTRKVINGGTRLFLHVFSWPENGRLVLPGIYNKTERAFLLADNNSELRSFNEKDNIVIRVPASQPDPSNSVVVLDLVGKPDVNDPPVIDDLQNIFIDQVDVVITTERENVEIYYTLDGKDPDKRSRSAAGGITIKETGLVTAQNFRDGRPVSGTTRALFTKVAPHQGVKVKRAERGLRYEYFEGSWDSLPDFDKLTKAKTGVISNIDISDRAQDNLFGFVFEGLILIQAKGVYSFFTDSDDGSQLFIGDNLVVDNDGLHSMTEAKGSVALDTGYHPIRVTYFEKSGANLLGVYYESASFEKQSIPDNLLFHKK